MPTPKRTKKNTKPITSKKPVIDSGKTPVWPYPNIVHMRWKEAQKRWRWNYKGKDYYYTGTADEALTAWQKESPGVYNPEAAPPPSGSVITVDEIINFWLEDQQSRADKGTISPKTMKGYEHAADKLGEHLGEKRTVSSLLPADFARVLKKYDVGLYRTKDFVTISKGIFRWAYDAHFIDREPAYGSAFEGPSDKQLRRHRAEIGSRDFTPQEAYRIVKTTKRAPVWNAMVWLSLNSGMSHADMQELPWNVIDGDVLRWFRVKTAFRRVCWLWPETVRALSKLPREKGEALVFPGIEPGRIVHAWRVVFDLAGIDPRHAQYDFRRTFITIAAESPDSEARKLAVGHRLPGVDDAYIQRFPVDRVRRVSRRVRAWLLSGRDGQGAGKAGDQLPPPAPLALPASRP